MSIRSKLINAVNDLFGWLDIEIVKKSRLDKIREFYQPSHRESTLPNGAEDYLKWNNTRLIELKQKYDVLSWKSTMHAGWTNEFLRRSINLKYFRGDNPYVYQFRDRNTEASYLLTTYYVKKIDDWNLLNLLKENGLFGTYTFKFGDLIVSRDLLDSIVEIYFLQKFLRISEVKALNILDVGAGYGRLAHRLASCLKNIGKVLCADAVAESTFLCEYYLRFCGLEEKTITVPLYDIEATLARYNIHLATNVCSFSECSLSAIEWWIDILRKYNIKYLFIVPDAYDNRGTILMAKGKNGYQDFLPVITSRGYRLITKQPKYQEQFVQEHGLSPTHYYLFEMSS